MKSIEQYVYPVLVGDAPKRLKSVRTMLGKNQVGVAQDLGVTQGCYSKYEHGKLRVLSASLADLRKVFGDHTDYILCGGTE